MRRWLRPLWVILALLFLLEAWLWDHFQRIVARVVDFIPWSRLKERLSRGIENLPPWLTLIVFVIPFIVLLPLKFLEVYFITKRAWLAAGLILIVAKLLGLGVTAFIFDVTRDKLLQMAWFRRMYDWVIDLRDWAHDITGPVRDRMRQFSWLLKPQRAGRFLRRFVRLRRRAYRNRAA
jgi:hypothetical protein